MVRGVQQMCREWLSVVMFLIAVQVSVLANANEPPSVNDLPFPKDSSDVTIVRRRGDIRFKVAADMKSVGEFYATTLGKQQWTKAKKDNLQRNFWVQSFAKENLTLEVRVEQRAGGSEVRLTPKGLLWDEDKQPRPKDIPIPQDAKDVKFDDFFERIEFQHAMTPEQLGEFYTEKLDAKTWAKSGTDVLTKSRVTLERTTDKASLTIAVTVADGMSAVTIRTKGMAWDDIKAANEQEKKSNAKVADSKSSSMKAGKDAPVLPKRKDKAKQGIAQLETLASSCVVTIDDHTTTLPSIVAYEMVSHGQWRTGIVATANPIKQQTLLETLKKTGSDEKWNIPTPYLRVELDETDAAVSLSFYVQNTSSGGVGRDLESRVLVEEGRVRGTVQMKPKDFFGKKLAASITFDGPLLTTESVAAKRMANLPKLAPGGKLTVGDRTYSLSTVTVYETKQFDDTVTAVLITEKPINLAKLKASLQKPAHNDDDFNEFQPQLKLIVDANEQVRSFSLWADGTSVSVSGSDNFQSQVQIEDRRARGTAKTTKADEAGKQRYAFDISFDTEVIPLPQGPSK